jgi:hypothetical protein
MCLARMLWYSMLSVRGMITSASCEGEISPTSTLLKLQLALLCHSTLDSIELRANHNTWTGKIENSSCIRERIGWYVTHQGAPSFPELEAKVDESPYPGNA